MPSSLFERKIARVRDEMRRRGVAAVVLAENGRTRYVSGYQRYYTATYLPFVHLAVVTLDAGPVLLLPRHIMGAADANQAERVLEFPLSQDAKIDTLVELLQELGAAKSRIAIELDFVQYGFMAPLHQRLPGAEIVDAAPLMNQVTAIKFPEEIELIRESARLVDLGIAAAIEVIREGATELEVGARSSAAMLEAGAEFINHMTVRSGPHAVNCYPLPTDRAFRPGDCVQLDIGCIVEGYVSDTNRTVVVGTATDEQRELLRVGQTMLERGLAAIRPGARAADVWRACFEVAEGAGMADRMTIPFAGHGLGLGLHEEPYVWPESDTILEAGMVIALEPGVYAPGIGGSRPEDTVVVTASGSELLTHYPRDFDLLS